MTLEAKVEVPSTSHEVASPTAVVVEPSVPVSNSFTEPTQPSSMIANTQGSLDQNSSYSSLYIINRIQLFLKSFMIVLCKPCVSC